MSYELNFMNAVNKILEFLFPTRCLNCRARGRHLCLRCLEAIPPNEEIMRPYIIAPLSYHYPVLRKAIWHLKYRDKKRIAEDLAGILYDRLLEELSDLEAFEDFRNPVLIPIPLSKKRLRERGYNQAEIIAREIIKKSDRSRTPTAVGEKIFTLITNVLYKIKDTPTQVSIKDREKRLQNLRGTFAVKNSGLIKDRNIILVDDVTTTGATIDEAKKVLEKSGARKVIALTVAH